jgi:hypothetical protein
MESSGAMPSVYGGTNEEHKWRRISVWPTIVSFSRRDKVKQYELRGRCSIGVRRWDDIRVQEERDILLGVDDELALQLAKEIRERLVQAFLDGFPYVQMNEERAYGDRSYFRNKYGPRPEPERDESSLSSEELSLADNDEDVEEIEDEDMEEIEDEGMEEIEEGDMEEIEDKGMEEIDEGDSESEFE